MKKIGILGGTFNPPHIGHLILAEEAEEQLGLDKVFFIPTNKPPHKGEDQLNPRQRLRMTQLVTEDNPSFEALDIEIKRKGVSYTVDTLGQLQKKYPKSNLYLIIGSDLANSFDKWRQPDKIKKLAEVIAAPRKGIPLQARNQFKIIDITQIGISSSQIRKRLKKGRTIKYLVPKKVESYIKKNNIYKRT